MSEASCRFCGEEYDTPLILDCCAATICGRCVDAPLCPNCGSEFPGGKPELRVNEFIRSLLLKPETLPTDLSDPQSHYSCEAKLKATDISEPDSEDLSQAAQDYVTLGKPLQQSSDSWDSSAVPPLPGKRASVKKCPPGRRKCQRFMKAPPAYICHDCRNLVLCESCENILHGIGVFMKHRVEPYRRPGSTDLSDSDSVQSFNLRGPKPNPNCLLANGRGLYS